MTAALPSGKRLREKLMGENVDYATELTSAIDLDRLSYSLVFPVVDGRAIGLGQTLAAGGR